MRCDCSAFVDIARRGVVTPRWITARPVIRLQSIAPNHHERGSPVTSTHQPEGLTFAPEYDQPVRYIERTRSWYQALGYPNVYQWAHYLEVPFAPLRKPLARSCVTFVTTAARYQSDKGPQGSGAPYNAAAKFSLSAPLIKLVRREPLSAGRT